MTSLKPQAASVSKSIDGCLAALQEDLRNGEKIAIGFEAPLFIPFADHHEELGRGRTGDGRWSALSPMGCTVGMFGLQQIAYILSKLKRPNGSRPGIAQAIAEWDTATGKSIFIWEAFISGKAHGPKDDHEADAVTGAASFLQGAHLLYSEASPCISLVGLAILRSGLSEDLRLLMAPSLILRPDNRVKKIKRSRWDPSRV